MRKRCFELSRGGACRFGPGMISTCFTFPISDCSILLPTDFGFILVLECGHLILCIFMKSKIDFHAFLLILVWLL